MKSKLKLHLYRSSRSTWCGKVIDNDTGNTLWHDGRVPSARVIRDKSKVTCKTCLKADAAEQRKEDAAS